jgi:hypothetical protein
MTANTYTHILADERAASRNCPTSDPCKARGHPRMDEGKEASKQGRV